MDIIHDVPWSSIAGVVSPFAPKIGAVLGTAIGTAIGGPFGAGIGSSIGGIAGREIANAFGVEATPQAVGQAIAEDPQAGDKLAQLEAERGEEIRAKAEQAIEALKQDTERFRISEESGRASVSEVNATIRAEGQAQLQTVLAGKQQSFFYSGWRPMAGHLLNLLTALIGLAIVYSMFKGIFTGNVEAMRLVLDNLMSVSAFLAILGSVVGVTAWGRSYEQGKAVQPAAPDATVVAAPIAAPPLDVASIVRQTIAAVRKGK